MTTTGVVDTADGSGFLYLARWTPGPPEGRIAFLIGTEAMIVAKDVLQLSDVEARKVRRWAIRALVAAALRE